MTSTRAPSPTEVRLGGLLGDALAANLHGRLSHFIVDEHSPAIVLFSPEQRAGNREGDWYGEHAGKWLYAAAKAVMHSHDSTLTTRLRRVADYLLSVQEADGYLGTYAPDHRFMRPQPPKPGTWDGAPSVRTWDIWTHAYLILGLVETSRALHASTYLDAARRIGDLCLRTLTDGGIDGIPIDITELGNHHGMSATVLMDPAVELYFATGDERYLVLAQRVLAQAEANPALALVRRALEGADASEIATGKAYQLIWNLVGVAKLHRASGEPRLLEAVLRLWENIRAHHLTLGGGPWGGVAHRSREVFNPANVFSPQGYVETCSTFAWIQLNRELLQITGQARYAEEIERSAYNDLLGAQAPDGEDWCYYSFPNGRRVHTTYWRCCKSSGAMALEELPALTYAVDADGVSVQLFGANELRTSMPAAGMVVITQDTGYPFDGAIRLRLRVEREARFPLRLRVPSWAGDFTVRVNGAVDEAEVDAQGFVRIERIWRSGDEVDLDLPITVRVHRACNRNIQESRAPDGSPVQQEVLRQEYLALTRGPLVYATGLIDGYKIDETLRLADAPLEKWVGELSGSPPGVELRAIGRAPLLFEPYYLAGGRNDGSWRLTWLSLAPGSPALTNNL
jgi:hypothetical protein